MPATSSRGTSSKSARTTRRANSTNASKGASVDLFDEMLPAMVSDEIMEMGTPQDEYPGERYFYTKGQPRRREGHRPRDAGRS